MRLTLANTLRNRTHQTNRGARLLNAFADPRGEMMRVSKRPALDPSFEALDPGAGLGLFTWTTPTLTTLVAITGNILNTAPTPTTRRLAFVVQPVDWKLQTAISPAVTVRATDNFGNTMTGFTGSITISLAENPSLGTLSGTLSVNAISGVATFSNLKLDRVGGGYKLKATSSGLRQATSSVFKIISNLAFTVQPGNNPPNTTFDTPVEVSVQDAASVTVAAYAGNISVRIGTNPAGGILSGTLTVATTTGIASFTNLEIDQVGNGYTLITSADAGGMIEKTSNAFNIVTSTHTLVAGTDGFFQFGFIAGSYGSLTPNTFNGATIDRLFAEGFPGTDSTILRIVGVVAQNFFTSITFNGMTLLSADASFSVGTNSVWEWPGDLIVTTTGTFPGTIV